MTARQRKRLGLLISRKRDEARKRYYLRHAQLGKIPARIVGDFADDAVRDERLGLHFTLEEHYRAEFRELEEAQQRLENKDFGRCQTCGEPIEVSRLLAVPETTRCIACATIRERQEGIRPSTHGGI